MLSDFVKYVKQYWHDRPDKSTPLNADRLNHIENGIGSNSEAINQIANAVVSNIVNDPEKIASMAAVYALQEKLGTGELPSDAPNAISAINTLYSNFTEIITDLNELLSSKQSDQTIAIRIFGQNAVGSPAYYASGIVISFRDYESYGSQLAIANGIIYSRQKIEGVWKDWAT